MPRFILKRLAVAIPVLLGVTFVVFAMMSLTGGDPARMMLGEDASAAEIAALRGEMGLNDPFLQRYARYLLLALRGDLGVSWSSGLPVAREVFTRLPVTFRLAVLSTLLAVTVGISAGVFSAVRRYSFWDGLATVIAMMSLTMPGFWLALLLVLFFSVYLGWLPPSGLYGPLYYILPVISISAASTAAIARTTRSGMLEVISQDYIRTVRARGMPETGVILRHALKNALIPIITVTGIQFAVVLGGAVVNEQVFALPGLGRLLVDAIRSRNYPVVQGGVLVIAVMFCLLNLLTDLLYALVDPRVRTQYQKSTGKKKPKRADKGAEL